ncbi:HNH endonuclease [Brachybacterium endophyticum]|uniref:HNH endonuclease n=1 Tax=Brachybacterium endophyticum TaxID=2182385 RepID=A0A2U2RNV3_9MICO|nr:HNH endonuclease [Brachybacterium endophyticum]PWH07553.1 HNH endonuclease [Brachybacterium endophyticum]
MSAQAAHRDHTTAHRAAASGQEAEFAALDHMSAPSFALPAAPEVAEDPQQKLARAHALIEEAYTSLADPASQQPADLDALLGTIETSERILALTGATQMRASVAFREARIAQQRAAGIPRQDLGKGVPQEIALARRSSPARTANKLALERVVVDSMPSTLDLLARGEISSWTADEVAKAALCLDDEDRAQVDRDIAEQLPTLSPPRAGALARARADEIDQRAALARHEHEAADSRVTIRPASDAMVHLSALMPMVEGIAVYKALDDAASSARARGEAGGRGRHMTEALFSRVTGLNAADEVDVEIQLLMTDEALLGDGREAAWIEGTPVPAEIARRLALGGDAQESGDGRADSDGPGRRFVRRLYTDPVIGQLTDADARRRRFTGQDRRFIRLADQRCRTPWCGARIRHLDHVERHADGGATTTDNGTGRCEACNYLMEVPGWTARVTRSGRAPAADRSLALTTPSGRTYTSTAPPLRRPRARSDIGDRKDSDGTSGVDGADGG